MRGWRVTRLLSWWRGWLPLEKVSRLWSWRRTSRDGSRDARSGPRWRAGLERTEWGPEAAPDPGDGHAKSPVSRARLKRALTPRPFFEVARDALRLRDDATAREVLQECVRRFPSCGPAYSLIAHIHERRFLQDLTALEGRLVVRYLAEACRCDPTNKSLSVRMTRFLGLIGFGDEVSSETDGCGLLETLDDERLDELLGTIEEHGFLPGDHPEELGRVRRERDRMRKLLPDVRRTLQSRVAAVVDERGNVWDEGTRLKADAFVRLARELLGAANVAARRTGLGSLRGALLESARGSLVCRRATRSALVALVPRHVPTYGCQERLQALICPEGLSSGAFGEARSGRLA